MGYIFIKADKKYGTTRKLISYSKVKSAIRVLDGDVLMSLNISAEMTCKQDVIDLGKFLQVVEKTFKQ